MILSISSSKICPFVCLQNGINGTFWERADLTENVKYHLESDLNQAEMQAEDEYHLLRVELDNAEPYWCAFGKQWFCMYVPQHIISMVYKLRLFG